MKKTQFKHSSAVREGYLSISSVILAVFFLLLPFLGGCHTSLRDGGRRAAFIPNVQPFEKKKNEPLDTEVVLTVEDRVDKIVLSADRKRLILETRHETPAAIDATESQADAPLSVELWNIEFADARPEIFSKKDNYLVGTISGLASFDEKGERLFWVDQEANRMVVQSGRKALDDSVVRGAPIDDAQFLESNDDLLKKTALRPLPLYLPWDDEENESPEETIVFGGDFLVQPSVRETEDDQLQRAATTVPSSDEESGELPDLSDIVSTSPDAQSIVDGKNESIENDPVSQINDIEAEVSDQPYVNVVMTKSLESDALLLLNAENSHPLNSEIKRLKTSLVTKNAEDVWLSSSAKWLVCRATRETEPEPGSLNPPLSTEDQKNGETGDESAPEPYSLEWALVPVRDRKRVVRFPQTVKMTFDSSTSDEEIQGRVVDVLAVSDAEDLVATLVEELSQNPRYKVVIWDLNVALTVDLEKALTPLRAIEVSQIALPYPVLRKYCKFSPSGKSFAARVDPRYVSVWQSTNGRPIVELGEHLGVVHDFEFSPGETKMVVGTGDDIGRVFLWEIRKGVAYQILDDFSDSVKSIDAVAFSSNERFVFFANDLGEIRRWDIRPKVKAFD